MSTPHLLLIVPCGWHIRETGLATLRQTLYLEWGATSAYQQSTSYQRIPVPLFTGVWPVGVDARLAPLIERAFHVLELEGA